MSDAGARVSINFLFDRFDSRPGIKLRPMGESLGFKVLVSSAIFGVVVA